MRIAIEPNNMFFRTKCWLCTGLFELGDPQPILYAGNERRGDVCPDCIDALVDGGNLGLAADLDEAAAAGEEQERREIRRVRELAEEIRASSPITIQHSGQSVAGMRGLAADPPRDELCR